MDSPTVDLQVRAQVEQVVSLWSVLLKKEAVDK